MAVASALASAVAAWALDDALATYRQPRGRLESLVEFREGGSPTANTPARLAAALWARVAVSLPRRAAIPRGLRPRAAL